MGAFDDRSSSSDLPRRLTRRTVLRYSFLSAAALSIAAACSQAAAPAPAPTTPAGPTTAAAARPTTAATAPTAAPTSAAAAAAIPTSAAGATFSGPPAAASLNLSKVKINGKLTAVQARDFYADHNTFVENQIKSFAQQMGYDLDHSYIEAYAGSGDVVQKLTAAVQAGDVPDVLIHSGIQPAQMHFLDIVEDVTDYEMEIQKQQGKLAPAFERKYRLDGKYWGIPHFSRNGGYWARPSVFKAVGVDPLKDFTDFNAMRDACLKASDANKPMYGWGMTANRSGDGDTAVRNAVFMWGGQVTDETGQLVVLNKDPYREYNIAALNWLKDVYTNPQYAAMLPPGVGGWTDTGNNEAWLAGQIGLTSNAGTVYAQSVHDGNPVKDDSVLVLNPKGLGAGARQLQNPSDPMGFFIMKGAKNRDAAFQLIQTLMTAENFQQIFTISTGYVYPAREWGWDQSALTEAQYAKNITPVWKQIVLDPSGFIGTAWPGPQTPQAGAFDSSNSWTDMFGQILGGSSVEQTLADFQNRTVQTYKEFGAKGE